MTRLSAYLGAVLTLAALCGDARADEITIKPCAPRADAPVIGELLDRFVRVRALVSIRLDPRFPGEYVRKYEYGSGTILEDGLIATAYHTLEGWNEVPASDRELSILTAETRSYTPVSLTAVDPERDLALLQANPRVLPRRSANCYATERDHRAGDNVVYAVGFRSDAEPELFEASLVRGMLLERAGRIAELRGETGTPQMAWIAVSQQILPGFSGGGFVDRGGRLLGMILGAPTADGRWREFSYGVSVLEMLKARF